MDAPTVVEIRSVDNWQSGTLQWLAAEQPPVGSLRGGIPRMGDFNVQAGVQDAAPYQAMELLMAAVMANFTFIGPFD